jgi:hypothetical protein
MMSVGMKPEAPTTYLIMCDGQKARVFKGCRLASTIFPALNMNIFAERVATRIGGAGIPKPTGGRGESRKDDTLLAAANVNEDRHGTDEEAGNLVFSGLSGHLGSTRNGSDASNGIPSTKAMKAFQQWVDLCTSKIPRLSLPIPAGGD